MFEELGPNMARTIVGESYNPDYKYELETSDEGLRLHITDKKTGECNTIKLQDEQEPSKHWDPLYDEERMASMRQRSRLSMRGVFLALSVLAIVAAGIVLISLLIKEGAINGF